MVKRLRSFRVIAVVAGLVFLFGCNDTSTLFKAKEPERSVSEEQLKNKLSSALEKRNFSEAIDISHQLRKLNVQDWRTYFLIAEAYAQLNQINDAIFMLEESVRFGLRDRALIDRSPNLSTRNTHDSFKRFLEKSFPAIHAADKPSIKKPDDENQTPSSISITEKNGVSEIRVGRIVIKD